MSIGSLSVSSGSGCGCNCELWPALRFVAAQLNADSYPGGASDFDNALGWIAGYDITTIPWGGYINGLFSNAGQTEPPSTQTGPSLDAYYGSQNFINALNAEQAPPCTVAFAPIYGDFPSAARGQAYIPFPTAYYIMAWGTPTDAALSLSCGSPDFWIAQACKFAQQPDDQYPMIVDLPIPDDTLDGSVFVQNYFIGIITPGIGYGSVNGPSFNDFNADNLWAPGNAGPTILQDLDWGTPGSSTGGQLAALNMNGLGPNFNSAATCANTVSPSKVDPFTGEEEDP